LDESRRLAPVGGDRIQTLCILWQRIKLCVEVLTGTQLDDHGAVRVLDADTWHDRRRRLHALGGPPLK
jgi:hypothetical protein